MPGAVVRERTGRAPEGAGLCGGPGTLWPWGRPPTPPPGHPRVLGGTRGGCCGLGGQQRAAPLRVLESLWVQEALSWQRAGAGFGTWRGPSMAVGGFCLSVLCFVCPASPAAAPALECWCWGSSLGWAVFVSRPCSALSAVPGMSQIPRTHRSLWFNIHLKEGDVRSCWEIALSRSSRSCCRLFLASDAALGSSPRPSASAQTL